MLSLIAEYVTAGYLILAGSFVLLTCSIDWIAQHIRRERKPEPEPELVPTYCPACLCIAHEHELDTADSGHPMLCDAHLQRLSHWLIYDMRTASEARKRIRLYPAPIGEN